MGLRLTLKRKLVELMGLKMVPYGWFEVSSSGLGSRYCALSLPWKLLFAVGKGVARVLICIVMQCGRPVLWIARARVRVRVY